MRLTLRALAALLDYPSAELQAAIPEIRDAFASDGALPRATRRRLDPLLDRLAGGDLLDLQVAYSGLFDQARSLSLHLFEHVHGESRERGPALINLAEQYHEHGLLLDDPEMPDFIPVFVEFASTLPPAEAREHLAQPAHVFAALEERLERREADYAAVFGALLAATKARPDREALEELKANAPDDDPARIDEIWEEREVTFTGAHEMGGPTGIVARIRARGKAKSAARKA